MKSATKRVWSLRIYDSMGSTNRFLKEKATVKPWETVRARIQTEGRGRFNRRWISVADEDLALSTVVPVYGALSSHLPNISQLLGLSLISLLKKKGISAMMKWPNDVLVDGKKIAGILVESTSMNGDIRVIVGIGVNVNSRLPKEIDTENCSIIGLLDHSTDMGLFVELLMDEFTYRVDRLSDEGITDSLIDELNLTLAFRNEKRIVSLGDHSEEVVIKRIAANGALVVEQKGGGEAEYLSAEISFKKEVL